jgi:hypothetical protein
MTGGHFIYCICGIAVGLQNSLLRDHPGSVVRAANCDGMRIAVVWGSGNNNHSGPKYK